MCAVPWAAAGRGKRNNYFSDPQGNIKKKEKEDGKKTEMEYKRRAEKKHNEEVEKKKITV